MEFQITQDYARALDQADPLAGYRSRFVFDDEELLYMDGNSLGRLPVATARRIEQVVREEWGGGLIRGWNQGWYDAPKRVGDKIGRLVGAAPGQVMVTDSTSVNLYKLAAAALELRRDRTKIISDNLNFPSDLYVLQGLSRMMGGRHTIVRVGASEEDAQPDLDAIFAQIDTNTALVTLSHVVFKSGYLYDMEAITRRAHQSGALVLWDLSHSVGVVEVELDAAAVDFSVGCTYKYLNGGPGAPAFLYVNKRLQDEAISPIWGWFGQRNPFDFGLDYSPASGPARFLAGTPPMLSVLAMETSLDAVLEAGVEPIRTKSVALTEYFIRLVDELLEREGFLLVSPREAARRGGHVSLRHPEAYRINRALIEELKVIPDFREPDNIRFGFSPLYTRFIDIWKSVERLRRVVRDELYRKYSPTRLSVT